MEHVSAMWSFICCLLIFVLIGLSSLALRQKNSKDYLLAGGEVAPWLVALSAVATSNSGYMFTGMIGFTYTVGLSSVWLMLGWILGDFFTSFFVHKRLREVSASQDVYTFAGILSTWNGEEYRLLRILCGGISLVFLGTYAAAQLSAGSKALHALFDWPVSIGALLGTLIVLGYCFAGGIRASIWTDAAQSFVMIGAMILLCVFGIEAAGGIEASLSSLAAVSPNYLSVWPADLRVAGWPGVVLFIAGWLFAGVAVIGQPHIMVRFMTLRDASQFRTVRLCYYSWYSAFYLLTIVVGLLARLLLPGDLAFDSEIALVLLSSELFPSLLVGLVLAALFAATISTADSLILSCSATITRDFTPKLRHSYLATKFGTVLVACFALIVSLYGPKSVFDLVVMSWATLGAAFAPLLLVYAMGGRPGQVLATCMVLFGVLSVLLWRFMGLGDVIYEAAPGITAGILVFVLCRPGRLSSRSEAGAGTH